jgi:hypothetical protein
MGSRRGGMHLAGSCERGDDKCSCTNSRAAVTAAFSLVAPIALTIPVVASLFRSVGDIGLGGFDGLDGFDCRTACAERTRVVAILLLPSMRAGMARDFRTLLAVNPRLDIGQHLAS